MQGNEFGGNVIFAVHNGKQELMTDTREKDALSVQKKYADIMPRKEKQRNNPSDSYTGEHQTGLVEMQKLWQ